jgi:hypothetical protein
MRAQLIVGQHIVDVHGLFEGQRHNERHFLCVEDGEWQYTVVAFTAYLFRSSFSVLPAMSLEDGFLHCEIVEGSFRADTFALFIQNLLENMQPFPQPNSVIVMDNCRIHKNPFIQEIIAARCVENLAHSQYSTHSPLSEASAVNSCPLILQITTRSSSRSRAWNITSVVTETTTVSQWLGCHIRRSTTAFSKPCIQLA